MAADQGVANEQNALGFFDAAGFDAVAAYMWFSLVAAQGDQDSKQQLDEMTKIVSLEQKAEAGRVEAQKQKEPAVVLREG